MYKHSCPTLSQLLNFSIDIAQLFDVSSSVQREFHAIRFWCHIKFIAFSTVLYFWNKEYFLKVYIYLTTMLWPWTEPLCFVCISAVVFMLVYVSSNMPKYSFKCELYAFQWKTPRLICVCVCVIYLFTHYIPTAVSPPLSSQTLPHLSSLPTIHSQFTYDFNVSLLPITLSCNHNDCSSLQPLTVGHS